MARVVRRALMVVALVPAGVQAQADTVGPPIPLFTYRDAVLAGSVTLGTLLARRIDERAARRLQDSSTQANEKLRKLATYVRTTAAPGTIVLGVATYAVGRLARNEKLADLGLHSTEALFVGELTAGVLKGFVGRARPSLEPQNANDFQFMRGFHKGDDYRSFPSGHTVAGFAAAAAVTSEMSRYSPDTRVLVGAVMYGGATMVGLSRMYNNRHWASDVIMGAGIGTFAGLKVVRWHHSRPGNRIDRIFLAGSLVPLAGGGQALHWSVMPDFGFGARSR